MGNHLGQQHAGKAHQNGQCAVSHRQTDIIFLQCADHSDGNRLVVYAVQKRRNSIFSKGADVGDNRPRNHKGENLPKGDGHKGFYGAGSQTFGGIFQVGVEVFHSDSVGTQQHGHGQKHIGQRKNDKSSNQRLSKGKGISLGKGVDQVDGDASHGNCHREHDPGFQQMGQLSLSLDGKVGRGQADDKSCPNCHQGHGQAVEEGLQHPLFGEDYLIVFQGKGGGQAVGHQVGGFCKGGQDYAEDRGNNAYRQNPHQYLSKPSPEGRKPDRNKRCGFQAVLEAGFFLELPQGQHNHHPHHQHQSHLHGSNVQVIVDFGVHDLGTEYLVATQKIGGGVGTDSRHEGENR